MKYTTNNVVVGKDSMGKSKLISTITSTTKTQYTNETAIETRIIDLETLGTTSKVIDEEELKEVTKEFKKQHGE